MREIKFRAWDKEEKQIGNVLGMYLVENGWVDIEILEERDDSDMKDKEYDDVEWRARIKDVELMQYTGLKDKNGKEIYESDNVKILHSPWGSQHLGTKEQKAMTLEDYLDSLTVRYEVVFIDGKFLGKRDTGSYHPFYTDDDGNEYTKLIADKHGYIEIIGNIYENPELLNKDEKLQDIVNDSVK